MAYYIHYLVDSFYGKSVGTYKKKNYDRQLYGDDYRASSLNSIINENREHLRSLISGVGFREENGSLNTLAKQLSQFYTAIQYPKQLKDKDRQALIKDDDVKVLQEWIYNYLSQKDWDANIDYDDTRKDFGEITLGHIMRTRKVDDSLYLKADLNRLKAKFEQMSRGITGKPEKDATVISDFETLQSNFNSFYAKVISGGILKPSKTGVDSVTSDSAYINDFNTYVQQYNDIVGRLLVGQIKDWGNIGEEFYKICTEVFANKGKRTVNELLDSFNEHGVKTTGSDPKDNTVTLNMKHVKLVDDEDGKKTYETSKKEIISTSSGLQVNLQSSPSTADLVVDFPDMGEIGISVKNYNNIGKDRGVSIFSDAHLLSVLSLFSDSMQGMFFNAYSSMHTRFPKINKKESDGPISQKRMDIALIRNELKIAGAIRGLTGIRGRTMEGSIKTGGLASLIVLNNRIYKEVLVFSTKDLVEKLLDNPAGLLSYIRMNGKINKYPNNFVQSTNESNAARWEAARIRNVKAIEHFMDVKLNFNLLEGFWDIQRPKS